MDKNVNTFRHEAAPIISADGTRLYFFVQDHPENNYGKDGSQDIWMCTKGADGQWQPAKHLSNPFNNHRSNQVFTLLSDGTLFIRGGKSKNEKGFSLVDPSNRLTELEVIDFESLEKGRFYGAALSEDRKHMILYFSETANSMNSDLYLSNLQADGKYSRPKKLKLSHSQDDFGPYIDLDQKTLYYASARPGAGRQGATDIYKTTRLDDTWENWS